MKRYQADRPSRIDEPDLREHDKLAPVELTAEDYAAWVEGINQEAAEIEKIRHQFA